MDRKDLHLCLAHTEKQFVIHQTYAMYWHAQAVSGGYKFRDTARGVEATPEEKAAGVPIRFRPQTDDEKLQDALATMKRHIELMSECQDAMNDYRSKLEEV